MELKHPTKVAKLLGKLCVHALIFKPMSLNLNKDSMSHHVASKFHAEKLDFI